MALFQNIMKAEERIRDHIRKTPLEFSSFLSGLYDCKVYLKLESEQLTGSFKIRGAFNKLLLHRNKLDGFVTASTGNHGKAVGYVSKMLKIKGIVYVPENVPKNKLEALQLYDTKIRKHQGTSDKVETYARKIAALQGTSYISPYNDVDVIAGQGTIGYEIWEQLPDVDAVFACIGGGGMISGIACYLKNKNKKIRVIGCEPKNSCAMSESIKAGKIIEVRHKPTLSDGSAGGIEKGAITFDFCKEYVDEYVQVTENEIKKVILYVMDKHHKIIEGAAAVPLAAFMKKAREMENKNVVIVLSGSGIGLDAVKKVILK